MTSAAPHATPDINPAGLDDLQKLALDLLQGPAEVPLTAASSDQPSDSDLPTRELPFDQTPDLVLSLEQVISDGQGEVVFVNDAGLRQFTVATDAAVVARGTASEHVTAGGEDVSGLAYVTFATGTTLYYPDGLELAVLPDA